MTIQTSRPAVTGASGLRATILDEIVGSHTAHVVIEELGLAMATHSGSKRDRNEDRIAVARIVAPNSEMYTVALVCDGVGGSELGDHAAALTVASIIADLSQQQRSTSLKELAIDIVRQADDLVRKDLEGRGATTLVMLLASSSGNLVCANVGDSRAYSWDSSSRKLDQITIDDTIENELKDLPGNPAAFIMARGLQGRLSQAIGESGRTADELRIQTYAKERFRHGAVLGSDGMWRAARDFEAVVANTTSPNDAARRAIALASWVGGVDNASLIVVGDVEKLCGNRQSEVTFNSRKMQITLWLSSEKIKLFTNELAGEVKPNETRSKPTKKKKATKKKGGAKIVDKSAQVLGNVASKEPRPKIEVMEGEEPDRNELAK
jgi:serine/threonine protein phosphatase PrpC